MLATGAEDLVPELKQMPKVPDAPQPFLLKYARAGQKALSCMLSKRECVVALFALHRLGNSTRLPMHPFTSARMLSGCFCP